MKVCLRIPTTDLDDICDTCIHVLHCFTDYPNYKALAVFSELKYKTLSLVFIFMFNMWEVLRRADE